MSTVKYAKQRQEYALLPEARECMIVDGEFYGVCANTRYKRTETHGRWLRQLNGTWVGVRRDCVPETLKSAYEAMAQTLRGLQVQSKH